MDAEEMFSDRGSRWASGFLLEYVYRHGVHATPFFGLSAYSFSCYFIHCSNINECLRKDDRWSILSMLMSKPRRLGSRCVVSTNRRFNKNIRQYQTYQSASCLNYSHLFHRAEMNPNFWACFLAQLRCCRRRGEKACCHPSIDEKRFSNPSDLRGFIEDWHIYLLEYAYLIFVSQYFLFRKLRTSSSEKLSWWRRRRQESFLGAEGAHHQATTSITTHCLPNYSGCKWGWIEKQAIQTRMTRRELSNQLQALIWRRLSLIGASLHLWAFHAIASWELDSTIYCVLFGRLS